LRPELSGLLVLLGAGDPGIPEPVSTTGVVALLLGIVTSILRGWVILPRELGVCQKALEEQREANVKLERDRDDWKAIALGTTEPLRTLATTMKENR
jgi:hypothetical protein